MTSWLKRERWSTPWQGLDGYFVTQLLHPDNRDGRKTWIGAFHRSDRMDGKVIPWAILYL